MFIVWIVADSMRRDYLLPGVLGTSLDTIAALARDSIMFENAYSQASFTTLSFASFLTGRYPWDVYPGSSSRGGRDKWAANAIPVFPEAVRTVFDVATEAGVRCASFTQPILGADYSYRSWARNADWAQSSARPVSPYAEPIRDTIRRCCKAGQPCMLFIRCNDTHAPWVSREDMHADGLPAHTWDDICTFVTDLLRTGQDDQVKGYIRRGMRRLDQELLLPILLELQAQGMYDHSTVILHADHGDLLWDRREMAAEQEFGHSQYVWESIVHVPLMVKFPLSWGWVGRHAGLCELRDVFFLAGMMLRSVYADKRSGLEAHVRPPREWMCPSRRIVHGCSLSGSRYATDGRYKVIQKPGGTQLFDLADDPHEWTDIAGTRHAEVLSRLVDALKGRSERGAVLDPCDPRVVEMLRILGYRDL